MEATQTTQIPQDGRPRRASRRRRAAAAALLAVLLLLILASALGGGPAPQRAEDEPVAGNVGDRSTSEPSATTVEEVDEAPVDADVELSSGDADPGDPGSVDLDPAGDGEPVDPCADHPAGQGSLRVVPDPLVLPSGDLEDELHVRNCGLAPIGWTAATKPTVTLAAPGGDLDPGEVTALGFAIQHDAWEPGAIDFKIKVSEPGHNHYVDVHAFRPAVGLDFVATTDLSAGPGVGGCADQCITKALISSAMTTPDVSLEVATKVPAKVRVYLSKHAPAETPAGNPYFPGKLPKATSPNGVQSWTTPLSNLEADTKYFIIVKATDGDGDTSYRSGSFRTIVPLEGPTGFAGSDPEPGCAAQCITKATVTPGDNLAPATVSVRSHTPAVFQLMLSTDAPTYVDGVPTFAKKDVWHTSGIDYIEAWDSTVSGLQPATKYYGIVVAIDANGHRHHAVGELTTDGVDLVITVHQVHLTTDGDEGLASNRGEVRFAWGVGDHTAGMIGERKLHPGADLHFARNQSAYVVHDAKGTIPTVYVVAAERDGDGLSEFCSGGDGAIHDPGYNAGCDTKTNVAASPDIRVGDLGHLQECSAFGIGDGYADDACLRLVSTDQSDDYPHHWAIVSFSVVE